MDPGSLKKAKFRAEGEAEEEEHGGDRLSNLPEALIHHILSLMDTKFAVQTCLLSTRWKSLWTSLPNLTFNSYRFHKLTCFDKFVSQVLFRRCDDLGVCDFNFTRRGSISLALLEKVAKYVKSHGVQRLSIDIAFTRGSVSLSHVLDSKSLKHFKLTTCPEFYLPFSLNLPALTTLHLQRVPFSKHDSINLFKCVNLRNLTLVGCYTLGLEVFNISSPQLSYLTVSREFDQCYALCNHWEKDNCKFVVSAPKLTSLSIKGFPPLQWYSQSLPSLEKVEIDTIDPYNILRSTTEFKESVVFEFINVLSELRNAKSVKLSSDAIKILSMFPGLLEHQPSPFSNLKSLKLKLQRSTTSIVPDHVMTYLLNCSPGVDVVTEFS